MKKGRDFMKSITNKINRLTLLSAFFIIAASSTYSISATSSEVFTVESDSKIPVSFSISTGVLNGESEEYVYEGSYGKVSKLTWDLDRVPMIGINTSVKPAENFSINFSGWTKISESGGNMEDYDWYLGDSEPWTDYSSSDTELDEAYMLDINASYLLYKKDSTSLTGEIGFRHDRYKWNAYGGYGTYSNWNYDPYTNWDNFFRTGDVTFPNEKTISYDQEFYAPYLGLTYNTKKDKWIISSYVRGSLWAWGEAEDTHYNSGYYVNGGSTLYGEGGSDTYKDEFDNIAYLSIGLNIGYMMLENMMITLSGDFQKYFRETGDNTSYYSYGYVGEYDDGAGTSNYSYMVSLGATYMF
jgi:outer membrane protease